MPRGKAWDAKQTRDSTIYKLLEGLSGNISALEDRIYRLVFQWDIRITDDLILEWEEAVGIPDSCRAAADDIEDRRKDVITKLKKIPVKTIADYEALAEAITGESGWNIRPGYDDYPSNPMYLFVLLITAPTQTSGAFTYPFGSGTASVSDLTSAGTTATATIADASTIPVGGTVVISGADQAEYNGSFEVTATTATTFDYTTDLSEEQNIVLLTSSGTTATATVADTSNMVDGSTVQIINTAQTEYSGYVTITITSATTFDYTISGSPSSPDPANSTVLYEKANTSPATGTIEVVFGIDQTQIDTLSSGDVYLEGEGTAFSGYPFAGSIRYDLLQCIFRKVTPANVDVVFE